MSDFSRVYLHSALWSHFTRHQSLSFVFAAQPTTCTPYVIFRANLPANIHEFNQLCNPWHQGHPLDNPLQHFKASVQLLRIGKTHAAQRRAPLSTRPLHDISASESTKTPRLAPPRIIEQILLLPQVHYLGHRTTVMRLRNAAMRKKSSMKSLTR